MLKKINIIARNNLLRTLIGAASIPTIFFFTLLRELPYDIFGHLFTEIMIREAVWLSMSACGLTYIMTMTIDRWDTLRNSNDATDSPLKKNAQEPVAWDDLGLWGKIGNSAYASILPAMLIVATFWALSTYIGNTEGLHLFMALSIAIPTFLIPAARNFFDYDPEDISKIGVEAAGKVAFAIYLCIAYSSFGLGWMRYLHLKNGEPRIIQTSGGLEKAKIFYNLPSSLLIIRDGQFAEIPRRELMRIDTDLNWRPHEDSTPEFGD